ncbi:MAG: PD-(D/E)XK nuclease family protein [Solirubrobacteraceae bacterium]
MALQLVTGPVNASKAGIVLGLVRAWAAAGRSPVLIVPTGPDADRYRRELLAGGRAVVGVTVGPFSALEDLALRAARVAAPDSGAVARDRAMAAALRAVRPPRPLAGLDRSPGARRRLLALLDDLGDRRVGIGDLAEGLDAMEGWEHGVDPRLSADLREVLERFSGGDEPADPGGAEPRLIRAGRRAAVTAARDALGHDPRIWNGRPVALYGFDDLTDGQLGLVATLADGADVVVSLPFEDGRPGTAARRELVDELRLRAADLARRARDAGSATGDRLPLRADDPLVPSGAGVRIEGPELRLPAPARSGGLGRIERRLFAAPGADDAPPPPGVADDAVLITGGDDRSEAEALAAALADARTTTGAAWHQMAVAVRDAAGAAGARIAAELVARGVPVARPREVPLRATVVGTALLAALEVAAGRGDAGDVAAVLRVAAGDDPAALDALDRWAIGLRRAGDVDPARWREQARGQRAAAPGLAILDALDVARDAGPIALPAAVADAVRSLAGAAGAVDGQPGAVASADRDPEPRAADVAATVVRLLHDLERVGERDPALLPDDVELADTLAELPIRGGHAPGPGRLEIAEPGELRGRQLRVLAIASLTHDAFPQPEPVDPLVDRTVRDALHAAVGLPVRQRGDRLSAERLLFLQLATRPTGRLLLSRPTHDLKGAERPASPFLADLLTALWPLQATTPDHRPADVVRRPRRHAVARPLPLGADLSEEAVDAVRRAVFEHRRLTVSDVEALVQDPIVWLVERFIGARDAQPRPVAMREGNVAHGILASVLEVAAADGRRYGDLDPEMLVLAAHREVEARTRELTRGLDPVQAEVSVRRVRRGVVGILRTLPDRFPDSTLVAAECSLGDDADGPAPLPPIVLPDGIRLVGRIDRIDRIANPDDDRRDGIGVVDYKRGSGSVVNASKWVQTGTVQTALYLHAASAAADEPATYGLYQSVTDPPVLGGAEVRTRKVEPEKRAGSEPKALYQSKYLPQDVADRVEETLERVREDVAALRAGQIAPRPGRHPAVDDPSRRRHHAVARWLT